MADKLIKARELDSVCVVDAEGRRANYDHVRMRGLPHVRQIPERKEPLAVVASGPSVNDYLDELKQWSGELWAINGGYDYCLDHGITPDGFFSLDPLPQLSEYLTRPQNETIFYIPSPADPAVFDALSGHYVQLYHPAGSDMEFPQGEWLIGGGTTALTRVPYFALLQGFRDITLYGCDSSFNGSRYCYQWGRYSTDIANPSVMVEINKEGPFETEVGLMKQVSQMGVLMTRFNGKLKVRCGGLMEAFLRAPIMDDSIIEVEDDAAKLDPDEGN